MGKHSTDLCALKGKLGFLLEFGSSKIKLATESACHVGQSLTEFAIQFRECEYSQSKLCSATLSAFRAGMWFKKQCDDDDKGTHQALFLKINKCKEVIAGLREFVFSLCSEGYVCIKETRNVRKLEKFGDLFSIWHCRHLEEVQAAAAKKLRITRLEASARNLRITHEKADRAAEAAQRVLSPVDLTEDIDPGASNSNSESSSSDSE